MQPSENTTYDEIHAALQPRLDEADASWVMDEFIAPLLKPSLIRVPLVWIDDQIGYRCPECYLFVCIRRGDVAYCPDCVHVPVAAVDVESEGIE